MTAVGPLLREWRENRRLSQLDLSVAADISTRHISFLETGRARPSREMVLRIADCLDLPLRERNRLLLSAGFAPVYSETPQPPPGWPPSRRPSGRSSPATSPTPRSSSTSAGTSSTPTPASACSPTASTPT